MADLATAYVQIIPSADGIKGKLTEALGGEAESAGKSAGSKLGSIVGGTMKTVAATGIAAIGTATAAIGAFGKEAVSTGMNFDSAMSQVAATMGMTTEDIKKNKDGVGDTFDALRAKAEEMGAATNFSASEAAEGLNILAMSGFSATDSMNMIEDVLHLAAAGGMEMASAAGYISGAMKGFNDETKDSGYYADLMAKGATLANTSVSQLGEAMASGAAGAAAYSQSQESMTVALLRLAEQGEVGSAAGTALSAAMKNLYTPTNQAKKALAELGVVAFDATTGKARDFNDVVNELDAALSGYTEEQQAAYKSTIFGIQGLDAYNKMTVTGIEKQNEWTAALAAASDGAGEASKQYETMTDNLQGDIDIFNSALDSFKIAVSNKITPTIREFVGSASEGISTVTGAFKEGGLEAAMGAAGDWLSGMVGKITGHLPGIVNAAMELLGAFGQGLLDNLPVIISAVTAIIGTILGGMVDALPEILSSATEIITTILQGLTDNMPTLIPAAIDAVMVLADGLIENLPVILEAGLELLLALTEGINDNLDRIVESVLLIVSKLVTTLVQNLPQLLETGLKLMVSVIKGLLKAIPELMLAVPKLIAAIIDGFMNVDWGTVGTDIMDGIVSGITSGAKKLAESAKEAANGALNGVKNFLGIQSPSRVFRDEVGKMMDMGLAEGLEQNTKPIMGAVNGIADMTQEPFTAGVRELTAADGMALGLPGRTEATDMASVQAVLLDIYSLLVDRKESVVIPVNIGSREIRRAVYDAEDMRSLRNGGR